ncbi:MAG TPA: DUF2155 domain-containing protein [Caulobacteraceae bacterium]
MAAQDAPAPDPIPTLPKAPIPYNQLRPKGPPAAVKAQVEEKEPEKPAEPLKRARAQAAILQALDKVTAETIRFEAPIGQPVRYKSLVFTVRACETSAPDELTPESTAYVVVDSEPRQQPGRRKRPSRQIFRGWMYASTPSINPLEHPVYDAWLIACRTAAPSPVNR